eukprot:SAG11_NODE_1961_length_3994_cov_5.969191_3_plen_58_part_00
MAEPSYGTIQPEDIVEEFGSGGGISRIVGGIGSRAFEPEPRCACAAVRSQTSASLLA